MPKKEAVAAHKKLLWMVIFLSVVFLGFEAICSISETAKNDTAENIACIGSIITAFGGINRIEKKANAIEKQFKRNEAGLVLLYDLIVLTAGLLEMFSIH